MDRETMSLPVANSQFYTAAVSSITSILSPISQNITEKETKEIPSNACNNVHLSTGASTTNTTVFELTEELTSKRPLRSEAEKEKRLSRTQSLITKVIDNQSESSNSRNSISMR